MDWYLYDRDFCHERFNYGNNLPSELNSSLTNVPILYPLRIPFYNFGFLVFSEGINFEHLVEMD